MNFGPQGTFFHWDKISTWLDLPHWISSVYFCKLLWEGHFASVRKLTVYRLTENDENVRGMACNKANSWNQNIDVAVIWYHLKALAVTLWYSMK